MLATSYISIHQGLIAFSAGSIFAACVFIICRKLSSESLRNRRLLLALLGLLLAAKCVAKSLPAASSYISARTQVWFALGLGLAWLPLSIMLRRRLGRK